MGWPLSIIFGDSRKKHKHYLKSSLKKIGNYKPTNWVLIEPNSNYHYGFIDAGLLNFPTFLELPLSKGKIILSIAS